MSLDVALPRDDEKQRVLGFLLFMPSKARRAALDLGLIHCLNRRRHWRDEVKTLRQSGCGPEQLSHAIARRRYYESDVRVLREVMRQYGFRSKTHIWLESGHV